MNYVPSKATGSATIGKHFDKRSGGAERSHADYTLGARSGAEMGLPDSKIGQSRNHQGKQKPQLRFTGIVTTSRAAMCSGRGCLGVLKKRVVSIEASSYFAT
jgi:hypothetical protein